MPDHVHALVSIPPKYAVSDIVRDVKMGYTKWSNVNLPNKIKFSWQEGFGSFAVSSSQVQFVRGYTVNQELHHIKMNFRQEYIKLLDAHNVEYDEKYLWK